MQPVQRRAVPAVQGGREQGEGGTESQEEGEEVRGGGEKLEMLMMKNHIFSARFLVRNMEYDRTKEGLFIYMDAQCS